MWLATWFAACVEYLFRHQSYCLQTKKTNLPSFILKNLKYLFYLLKYTTFCIVYAHLFAISFVLTNQRDTYEYVYEKTYFICIYYSNILNINIYILTFPFWILFVSRVNWNLVIDWIWMGSSRYNVNFVCLTVKLLCWGGCGWGWQREQQ